MAAAGTSLLMLVLWLVQRRTGNAGTVDVAWTASIGAAGVWYALTGGGAEFNRWAAGLLAAGWSLRLTWYLFRRVVGHPEEGRYATLRSKWGAAAQLRFFVFFQMQAAAAVFFSLPFWVLAGKPAFAAGPLEIAGLVLYALGVAGVALADRQLARFRRDPANKGRTCQAGLWRYSRHPNYFFEWIHWCAYVPLAVGTGFMWLVALVPLALLYFFFFVTGIPPTEAQALASRGEEYRRYQRTTSVFVPWWPRQEPKP